MWNGTMQPAHHCSVCRSDSCLGACWVTGLEGNLFVRFRIFFDPPPTQIVYNGTLLPDFPCALKVVKLILFFTSILRKGPLTPHLENTRESLAYFVLYFHNWLCLSIKKNKKRKTNLKSALKLNNNFELGAYSFRSVHQFACWFLFVILPACDFVCTSVPKH